MSCRPLPEHEGTTGSLKRLQGVEPLRVRSLEHARLTEDVGCEGIGKIGASLLRAAPDGQTPGKLGIRDDGRVDLLEADYAVLLAFDDLGRYWRRAMANGNVELTVILIGPDAAILPPKVGCEEVGRPKPESLQRFLRDLSRNTFLAGVELRNAGRRNENRGTLSLNKNVRIIDESQKRDIPGRR